MDYVIRVRVKEVRGYCALGYKPGDEFIVEKYFIRANQKIPICLHALNGIITLLILMLKGYSAKKLGIGETDDIGYVQCPDPGKPYTSGGTVIFELKRESLRNVRKNFEETNQSG